MASLDKIEGGLTEGTTALVAVILIAIVAILYASWKNFSLPVGAYPYSLWAHLSDGIDWLFSGTPLAGGKIQKSTDHVLGGASSWLLNNTPNPAASPKFADYASQFDNTDSAQLIAGLGGQG